MTSLPQDVAQDIILKHIVNDIGEPFTASRIQRELFENSSLDEINFLFEKINNTVDRVADLRINEGSSIIIATELTNIFLNQGGFIQVKKEERELKKRNDEKDSIKLQNAIIDLKLKKRQSKTFWFVFIFALIGTSLSVYSVFDNLSTSRNIIKQEKQIFKIESQIKELRTIITTQKINFKELAKDSLDSNK